MFIDIQNIENFSDEELRTVADQVIQLYATGVTNEKPLREMIDSYIGGSAQGIIAVPHAIMLECTKRWCMEG